MIPKFFDKKNNIFQSPEWIAFQKSVGREVVTIADDQGIVTSLPMGRKFVWLQKAPSNISNPKPLTSNLPKGTVFVRLEPGTSTEADVRRLKLRPVSRGSLLSGQTSPKATRILDITGSEEEILAQMKSKTRYNIRLAQKREVNMREAANVEELCSLLEKTASRDKGYAPHPRDYYEKMLAALGPKGLIKIFVAEHEGEPLAAILVSFYGEVATYLHGGFDESQRNLMAPYLCQWEAIKYAKAQGCAWYDFWGVCEDDDPADSWAGITRFKEGFGGEKVVYPGSYDLVVSAFWYQIFSILAKIKRIIGKK